jgi:RNA polymerase sigma factor (sigma-70 family)
MMNLEEFYRSNYNRHVKTISRILHYNKDLAEDVVQEAYTKAFQYTDTYDVTKGSVSTWFNRILFNTLRDTQNSFVNTVALHEGIEGNEQGIEYLVFIDNELKYVRNSKHKRILELFYLSGYSSTEIAKLVGGVSQTNVTTICKRFKDGIKEKYGVSI